MAQCWNGTHEQSRRHLAKQYSDGRTGRCYRTSSLAGEKKFLFPRYLLMSVNMTVVGASGTKVVGFPRRGNDGAQFLAIDSHPTFARRP